MDEWTPKVVGYHLSGLESQFARLGPVCGERQVSSSDRDVIIRLIVILDHCRLAWLVGWKPLCFGSFLSLSCSLWALLWSLVSTLLGLGGQVLGAALVSRGGGVVLWVLMHWGVDLVNAVAKCPNEPETEGVKSTL